jgi:hypothetical protein
MREYFVARPYCYFTPFLHFGKCLPGSGAVSSAVLADTGRFRKSLKIKRKKLPEIHFMGRGNPRLRHFQQTQEKV